MRSIIIEIKRQNNRNLQKRGRNKKTIILTVSGVKVMKTVR